MSEIPEQLSQYLAEIGARGGLARTEKKKRAGKRNAAKAREAKQRKRLGPAAFVEHKRQAEVRASWDGAVSLEELKAAQEAQRAAEGQENGLRIQQTGRRR